LLIMAVGCGTSSGVSGSGATGGGGIADGGMPASGGTPGQGGGSGSGPGGGTVGGNSVGGAGAGVGGEAGAAGSETGGAAGGDSALPCDSYAAEGTPCVAAHSTTRALIASYNGKLYQVQRADKATLDIETLSSGYADSAAQDKFCAGSSCTITVIYDQTSRGNHLTVSPGGTAGPTADRPANASDLPALAGGQKVYGVYISPGMGYRNVSAKGTARAGQAEGMYMVTSGTHVNGHCCFDYGNTEQPVVTDQGNGHMDAIYFGMACSSGGPCSGPGPWIGADLENGLFHDDGVTTNPANAAVAGLDLVTAMLKNDGQKKYALKSANAEAGVLTTHWNGSLPTGRFKGYMPMKQEGGIVLGVGGDNSNRSEGDFYEGVMTFGYPTDSAEDKVQANIASVGYKSATVTEVLPTSEFHAQAWRYTTSTPDATWPTVAFKDTAWTQAPGGFGVAGALDAVVGTLWNTADIWLRRSFNPGKLTAEELGQLTLRLYHDDGTEVYINGVKAFTTTDHTRGYVYAPVSAAALKSVIVNGTNTLAVHCHQAAGAQYIDVGIVRRSLP